MKKNVFLVILTILLFMALTSCSLTNNNVNEATDDLTNDSSSLDHSVTDSHEYEPVFLIVMSESVNTSSEIRNEFEDAEKYGLYCTATREVIKDLENATRKSPIDDQVMKYAYSECSYNRTSKEHGTHYSVYDFYKTDSMEVGVLHGTDLICYYFNRQTVEEHKKLTDIQAKSLADSFVLSVVEEDVFNEFDSGLVKADTSGVFSYTVKYSKTTNGYKTDESITVYIDKLGNVVGYNGYNVCKYDTLKDQFADDKIGLAKKALVDKINSLGLKSIEMTDSLITTDIDGGLYVRIDFSYENDDGFVCGETALVNIN